MKLLLYGTFHAIFWLWNLTFLLIVYAGILPVIAPALIEATFANQIPLEFGLTLVALVAVPTVCTILAGMRFSKQPAKLIRLFYGVEAPLFLLCLIRLFLLRELTPASAQIVTTVVVCIAAFSLNLLFGYANQQRPLAWLQMLTHSLMLLVGLYVGLVLMFYAVPVAGVLLREFFKFEWISLFWQIVTQNLFAAVWWIPTLTLLFVFTSTLFVAMPSALAALYVLSGREVLKAFAAQYGKTRTWVGAGAVITAWLVVFLALQQQPQVQVFNWLDRPAENDSSRQVLLAKSGEIRTGLLNAYLMPYRYLSTRAENNHIEAMYRFSLGLPQPIPAWLQQRYNQLMSPFLYQGSRSERDRATQLYAQFFDTPIQRGEPQAIQRALQSTFNQEEAKAGLLNINEERVWLRSQQVNIQSHGDWADVELYEVYENKTSQVEEILYYFSLPESAVVTGLWLGESENRSARFPFVVSPRGAAQKVYNEQVRRNVDPALLEQVGPRQYRLRAFPIPAQLTTQPGVARQEQPRMHLWLTYKVLRQPQGWALPQLREKRNIFWNQTTQRQLNGQELATRSDNWLEPFIAASGQNQPQLHQVDLTTGDRLVAQPLTSSDYTLPQGQRFAIVLDTSRSMAAHVQQLSSTFKQLLTNNSNDIDLYVTSAPGVAPKRINDIQSFDPAKLTFYGTLQYQQLLQQFAQLRSNQAYDAILLITDQGSYELAADSKNVPAMSAPVWMVHLGGMLPPAYDDATLKAIQDSNGGVATETAEVWQRMATPAKLGESVVSVVDGYAWRKSSSNSQVTKDNGFAPFAARQLVLELSKAQPSNKLAQLDNIHAVAKNYDIVTPYSSMLVLVDDQQREQLKQAEADKDRFDREVESGQEQLTQPNNPFNVSAVPEPEEWMLMAVVAIALLLIARRRRQTVVN